MDIETKNDVSASDHRNQDASSSGLVAPAPSVEGSVYTKSAASGSNNVEGSSSDTCLPSEDEESLDCGDDDYVDDCSDYDYDDEYLVDDYSAMQSQFDNVDLPAGVEVSLPWIADPAPTKMAAADSAPAETGPKLATVPSVFGNISLALSSTVPSVPAESSTGQGVRENSIHCIVEKFNNFKRFDTAADFSDHHYSGMGFKQQQPPKNWAKRIQEEWTILDKDLPETIFVRVYEERMELLRAVIIGPSATPYHDGIFVFDCHFPPNYPNEPPMVYYYSGGLRLNPNLYECGKVCLSLLGTWRGDKNENWIPGTSTMLQVLVSIQALILNAEPYFNEPGYEEQSGTKEGKRQSNRYSEEAFIYSLKTMVYTLRRPPKYFEDFVVGHFHNRAHDILVACTAYVNGAAVGSVLVKDGKAEVNDAAKNASHHFRQTLKKMMNSLVTSFNRFASVDCGQFRMDN